MKTYALLLIAGLIVISSSCKKKQNYIGCFEWLSPVKDQSFHSGDTMMLSISAQQPLAVGSDSVIFLYVDSKLNADTGLQIKLIDNYGIGYLVVHNPHSTIDTVILSLSDRPNNYYCNDIPIYVYP